MPNLICGDCLDILKTLPDKSIDLVLTDPPYGIGECGKKNHSRGKLAKATQYSVKDWDYARLSKEYFDEMLRVSKHQIIFGGNYYIDYLRPTPCFIIWDKDNGASDFADCELAWASFPSAVRKIKWRWQGFLQEDMRHKDKRVHPTQKPLGVMRWILEKYSTPGQTVLDPFMGSGTTGVACAELGREFIGIEKDPEYFDIAKARIAAAKHE